MFFAVFATQSDAVVVFFDGKKSRERLLVRGAAKVGAGKDGRDRFRKRDGEFFRDFEIFYDVDGRSGRKNRDLGRLGFGEERVFDFNEVFELHPVCNIVVGALSPYTEAEE